MKNTIKVEVTGATGSGKSGIVQIIHNALAANGFQPRIIAAEHGPRTEAELQTVIESIKAQSTSILIEEF
jgi:nucleoside-triphosphatase THEP1